MRFATILATAASLASLSSARIIGIAVPETIRAGDGFNAIILTENYIQSVYDVAIAFGVAPGSGYPDALGNVIGSWYLGPEQSNTLSNVTKWATMPSGVQSGQATVSASLYSLYGAEASQTLSNYEVTVTIGDSTSTNYVSSLQN